MYNSDVCLSSFPTAKLLNQHSKIHKPRAIYECPECYSTFNQQKNMYFHLYKLHQI